MDEGQMSISMMRRVWAICRQDTFLDDGVP